MNSPRGQALTTLPETFRYSDALDLVSERQLRGLIDDGEIIALARGLYRKAEWFGDEGLIQIAAMAPRATICLRSALARHELIDHIPAENDIAIPRGSWAPETAGPVRWRHFDAETFEIGRDTIDVGGGQSIGLYSAERSIVDAFRMRHLEGAGLANEALKCWLRRGGRPSDLLAMARVFPRVQATLRKTLEILL